MIRPLFGNVLVEPIKQEDQAGIYLKEAPNAPQRGRIVRVGGGEYVPEITYSQNLSSNQYPNPHLMTIPMLVSTGDEILFQKETAKEISIDQKPHYLLNQKDILGVVEF